MKISIKDFFSKRDQIRSFLLIWSHLLKKSLMENFIFCAVEIKENCLGPRNLASDSAQCLVALAKDFFLEGRLSSGLCL